MGLRKIGLYRAEQGVDRGVGKRRKLTSGLHRVDTQGQQAHRNQKPIFSDEQPNAVEDVFKINRLIEAFGERTGTPILLNTSFNENEPVVNRPEEAIDCFLRTRMDTLVVGKAVLRKSADGSPRERTAAECREA